MPLNYSVRSGRFFDGSRHGLLLVALAAIPCAVLEGTLTDASGAAIVGAKISAQGVQTGIAQEQRTKSNGYYLVSGLAPPAGIL
jgi:hypothetical protein